MPRQMPHPQIIKQPITPRGREAETQTTQT